MSTATESSSSAVRLDDGRKLAYVTYGAPDGAPVIYCHGGLSSHLDISFADEAARRRGVRILAVDRPGTGESDRLANRRVVDWAVDIAGLASALDIDRFSVLGWSAGGPFALACAARLGSRVEHTATVGGMAPLGRSESVSDLGLIGDRLLFPLARFTPSLAGALLRLRSTMPRPMAQRRLVKSLSSPADRAVIAAMSPLEAAAPLAEAVRHGTHGLVDDFVVLGRGWGFQPEDIGGPVTVFQGDQDTLLPMAHAESLAARLRSGGLTVVGEAGHFLLHTNLDRVLDALGL